MPKAAPVLAPKPVTLVTLKRRRDFVAMNDAANLHHSYSLLLQTMLYGDSTTVNVGFTATKRLGNAVARNRAKRRLRAIARERLLQFGQNGQSYVFIAKPATLTAPYARLLQDLDKCLSAASSSR